MRGKGMGIGIADFNDDGWMDVFIANDTEPNFLFVNQKNGTSRKLDWSTESHITRAARRSPRWESMRRTMTTTARWTFFTTILWGSSGRCSTTSAANTSVMFLPSGKFSQLSAPYSGWSGGFIDYNNDGWKDLFSANGDVDNLVPNAPQHDTMFENRDGKEFMDVHARNGRGFQSASGISAAQRLRTSITMAFWISSSLP